MQGDRAVRLRESTGTINRSNPPKRPRHDRHLGRTGELSGSLGQLSINEGPNPVGRDKADSAGSANDATKGPRDDITMSDHVSRRVHVYTPTQVDEDQGLPNDGDIDMSNRGSADLSGSHVTPQQQQHQGEEVTNELHNPWRYVNPGPSEEELNDPVGYWGVEHGPGPCDKYAENHPLHPRNYIAPAESARLLDQLLNHANDNYLLQSEEDAELYRQMFD